MNNQHQTVCGFIILIAIAFGLYLIIPKATEAYEVYGEVKNITQQVDDLKNKIENIKVEKERYEKEEKISTKPVYKNEVEVSDRMSSFGVMFEDVIQSAKYNGLKLRSIGYNENPASDAVNSSLAAEYNVCAISMQLIGSYMQFRSYFQDIYNYPYLVNLDTIDIKPYEKNKKILISDVIVTLYSTKNAAQKAAYEAAMKSTNQDEEAESTGVGGAIPTIPAP